MDIQDIQEEITGIVKRGRKGEKQVKQLQHIKGDTYEYQSLTPSASVFKSSGTFVPGTYTVAAVAVAEVAMQ